MPVTKNRIQKNLNVIHEHIAKACDRIGRSPEQISIVAVTKTVEVDTIKNLLEHPQLELLKQGENVWAFRILDEPRKRGPAPEPLYVYQALQGWPLGAVAADD